MESFEIRGMAAHPASGQLRQAIIGVNASGNLEVLVERTLPDTECIVGVTTQIDGFRELWQAVIEDFMARASLGGLRFSINDGGAKPDIVTLRLMQSLRRIEAGQ